ncbi:MAG: DNA repair protein RecN, partial [Bacteroidales bacterium]|nr:DNA repair protein RecN [Bacteroidales bacterium]
EFSPERIETINQRLTLLYNLQKKNGVKTVEELIAIRDNFKQKLNLIDNSGEIISDLKEEIKDLESKLSMQALSLSEKRRNAAQGLAKEVVELLASVGIPDAQFAAEFFTSSEFLDDGNDMVKFMFSANKNMAMQDLSKTASGGELSRLMLCLKYILSKSVKLPTIIFDEIDTGISGDIAGKTGAMFKRIAEFMQVICITHLPQVAAMGKHHFKVFKHEEGGAIRSDIKLLTPDERINEIAAMLSGETVSQAAVQNARELLQSANN